MNDFADVIKVNLLYQMSKLEEMSSLFLSNPQKDLTRKRKLDFQETIRFILSMGGLNIKTLFT